MVSADDLDRYIDDAASIHKLPFQVTIGVFFGVAMLSVVARVAIRLKTLRRLSLDDYLLFFAAVALTVATGLLYGIIDRLYLSGALQKNPVLAFSISSKTLFHLLNTAAQLFHTFLIFAWTATFFVKFSFLAFFRQLIWKTKIQRYYWFVVGFTVLTYLFLISEPFILCPDYGIDSLKCFSPNKSLLYISLTGLVTSMDVITDLMIVSIPIIILYQARIQTQQKIALGAFLCLSLVMVCLAIVRASKIKGSLGVDIGWEFFWQFLEAAVAVLMGSLTVFRTLLAFQINKSSQERKGAGPSPQSRAQFSFHQRMQRLRKKRQLADEESLDGLPQVPSATLAGMHTFIRRNNRDPGLDTLPMSQNDTLAENYDANGSSYRVTVAPSRQGEREQDAERQWPLLDSGFVHVSTEIRQETWRNPEHTILSSSCGGSTVMDQADWDANFYRDSISYRESYQPYQTQ